jgi:hypothetical protein
VYKMSRQWQSESATFLGRSVDIAGHGDASGDDQGEANLSLPRWQLDQGLSDWSETGRGSHVDFGPEEVVPLKEGRKLNI